MINYPLTDASIRLHCLELAKSETLSLDEWLEDSEALYDFVMEKMINEEPSFHLNFGSSINPQ